MKDTPDLTFDMAGLKIRFTSRNHVSLLTPAAKFQKFLYDGPADVNLEVIRKRWPMPDLGAPVFTAASWSVSLVDNQILLRFNTLPDPSSHPLQAVLLHPEGRSGEVWASDKILEKIPLVVPPLLLDELLAVYLLARGWGVMLHACGLKTNPNQGLLFSGVSGMGKSTTARLWRHKPGTKLLSDERVVIRKQEGKFQIFATPWNSDGQSSEPGCAPLDHLFLLRHSPSNQARRLQPNEALSQLMAMVFFPHGDQAGLAFTLDFLGELVNAVPCYELGFIPDESAVDFVQRLVDA